MYIAERIVPVCVPFLLAIKFSVALKLLQNYISPPCLLRGSAVARHRRRCLQEKRCVSMPSVSLTSSNSSTSTTLHRSKLLRLQDKRFRHRFSDLPEDEKLLNYFSCALVSDILLQGHLFITKNYFAFYSNIFGHKTQILIPIVDVVKVTKEKIAKFIPNAVGVYTESDKYVFGSMLSRDTAFRVIQQTWILSTDHGLGLPDDSDSEVSPAIMLLADEDSSVSSGISGNLMSDEMAVTSSEMPTTPEVVDPLKARIGPELTVSQPTRTAPPHPAHSTCTLQIITNFSPVCYVHFCPVNLEKLIIMSNNAHQSAPLTLPLSMLHEQRN
ncbi:protein Aster-A [Caerostris extrusa]|uniref:Protein Aster-A n=1 Tax=Caerostris extrusa TaxID=172846 RepID=A0AAV4YBL2_CAEEX|nr:protein Aster-A [Caerostris extrusa]